MSRTGEQGWVLPGLDLSRRVGRFPRVTGNSEVDSSIGVVRLPIAGVVNAKGGLQILRTRPSCVARVLRTNNRTRIIPTNGTSAATITIGSNTWVAAACLASAK